MVEDFRVLDRDTPMLLPASIQEWLPERHMARFVVDIVEQLELGEITSQYGGSGGKQAYHPAMLVALLFYGYEPEAGAGDVRFSGVSLHQRR